jgi:hypothetical protein
MLYCRDELTKMKKICFRDFPNECKGCDYYKEEVLEPIPVMFFSPEIPVVAVTKECSLYHKKVTERLK